MNFANIKLTKQEYAQFMAAVNTNYLVRYIRKKRNAIIITIIKNKKGVFYA